jgi:kievitone hydratase
MVNGEKVEVVPELSSTWYDRQWASLQDSFQWIAMIFEESDWLDIDILVNWDWTDAVNGPKEFATLRSAKTGRDSVVPITMTESSTIVYTSPETGIAYPLEFVVQLGDIEIVVTTPRDDQIFEAGPDSGFPPQFSGYVDIVAKKAGFPLVKGYVKS